MTTKYTKEEIEALRCKERAPKSIVICPRCGKELIFDDRGCAYAVKCPTENCLKMISRGI